MDCPRRGEQVTPPVGAHEMRPTEFCFPMVSDRGKTSFLSEIVSD